MRPLFGIVAAGMRIGLTAVQAQAFALTGTWQGEQVCKLTTVDGKERQVFRADVLDALLSAQVLLSR